MQDNFNVIDDIMGFNPQDLSIFNEPVTQNTNVNVYKTNPVNSKSEDGVYRSRIRIIYNPFDVKRSIVRQATYAMTDEDGFFIVKSKLGDGDRNCPIFKAWKKLWFSNDEQKKALAKEKFDKTETQWVLVQIMEDDNFPELKGQIKVMKLPKAIFEKMTLKMNPSPESKKIVVPVMDYLFGVPLDMEVQPGPDDPSNPTRKQREISYSRCDFGIDPEPIIKVDGTPLFTDEELELIEQYNTAKNEYQKAKSEAKKKEKETILLSLKDSIKGLYVKSLDYLKEHSLNLVDECAYREWDEETADRVQRWIDGVLGISSNPVDGSSVTGEGSTNNIKASSDNPIVSMDDDLPF